MDKCRANCARIGPLGQLPLPQTFEALLFAFLLVVPMSPSSRSAGPFLLINPSFWGHLRAFAIRGQMSDGQNERRKRKICLETAGNGKGERRKGWRLAGRQRHIGLGRRQNNKGRRRGKGIARSEKATANILGGGEMDAGKKGQPVVPAGIHSPGCPVPHFAPKGIDCPIRLPPLPLFYPHNILLPNMGWRPFSRPSPHPFTPRNWPPFGFIIFFIFNVHNWL